MKRACIALSIAVLAVLISANAFAAPIYCSVTGHWYEAVSGRYDWETARDNAIARGGYLATITSEAENTWIWEHLGGATLGTYWLGGFQPSGFAEPPINGGWEWVTGETWSNYVNWDVAEPNQWTGWQEDYLAFSIPNTSVGNLGLGRWNDAIRNAPSTGYVVESVPEPASLSLLGLGLAGLLGLRRKKRVRS